MALRAIREAFPRAVLTPDQERQIVEAIPVGVEAGPIVAFLIALAQNFVGNLPAILAYLQQLGVVLPAWANIILKILCTLFPAT